MRGGVQLTPPPTAGRRTGGRQRGGQTALRQDRRRDLQGRRRARRARETLARKPARSRFAIFCQNDKCRPAGYSRTGLLKVSWVGSYRAWAFDFRKRDSETWLACDYFVKSSSPVGAGRGRSRHAVLLFAVPVRIPRDLKTEWGEGE